ncbi:phage tail tape measure protein [Providencia sp. PROV033]|uniref:phage tail tape measure protein n=1 Tax=Providencia sp. PROV033 TaxID=2949765 RepID=UPI00234A599A|nr:phage tail tape measure protein [Providencia sp. PROV033]
MAKEFKLSMVISARDDASKAITKAMRGSTKESQNAEKAQEKLGKRQRTTSEEGIRQNRALGEEIKRQNRARETLGIRAERAIQREIQQTVAAYNRLARSGTLSIDEQSRAYERMRQRVSQLKTEMQGMSKLARLSDIGGNLAQIGGAMVAGGMAVAQPVKKQMSYSRRLANMSNVAFNDRDIQGRIEGKKELDSIIQDSIAKGGGTKEEAANLLGGLLDKGVFKLEKIKELMPLLQQYSTATGVGGEELAKVAESLKEYGITSADEMMKVMDAAIRSGQEGSFEFSDMAKWLPEILSKAKVIGYSGSEDIVKLLAYSQGMMKNVPTADTAGNNFVDLLNKVPSQELATRAKAIKVDGYGIDMAGTLTQALSKGIDPISALVGLTDVIARQNPEFRKLEEQLSKTDKNSPEHQKLLESQRRILESSAIGQLIADQQALLGLLAAREYRGYIKQVETESKKQLYLPKGQGEGYVSYGVIAQENDFKVQQAKEQGDFAEMGAVKPLSDSLGNLADKFTDFSKEFPMLTTAAMGAKTAIDAMTQAAVAFAALKFLLGGGSGLGGILGGKGTPKPGMFNPIGGAGTGGLPVHVTNWKESGFNSNLFDKNLLGKFGVYSEILMYMLNEKNTEDNIKSLEDKRNKEFTDEGLEGSKYPYLPAGLDIWLQKRDQRLEDKPISVSPYLKGESASPFLNNERAIDKDVITFDTLEKSGVLQPLLDLTQALKNPPPPPVIEVRSVVELDGQQVAESVNRVNGQDAGRSTGGMFP